MSVYAIIKAGGAQVKVTEGELIRIEKVTGEPGAEIVFPNVLLVASGDDIEVGTPYIAGARVVGEVQAQGKGKKIRLYQFHRKRGWQRTLGHRQRYTAVRIKSIVSKG